MPDVIKTYRLSTTVANAESIVATVARHGHRKRLRRVQVSLSAAHTALKAEEVMQQLQIHMAQKGIWSEISVRPNQPGSNLECEGMHEVTLFERPPGWKQWLIRLIHLFSAKKPPARRPISPDFNPMLHKAFGQAMCAYPVSKMGNWVVQGIVINYSASSAYDTLAPMISAMSADELLAYLARRAGRNDLLAADLLTVVQQYHPPQEVIPVQVGHGDLWLDVVAQPANFVAREPGDLNSFVPLSYQQVQAVPAVRRTYFALNARGCTQDHLVRHLNHCMRPNMSLSQVELHLSRLGNPELDVRQVEHAAIELLRERGEYAAKILVAPFAHDLQHADAQHGITLLEQTPSQPWWQRLVPRLAS